MGVEPVGVRTMVKPKDRGGACESEDNGGGGSRSVQELASRFVEVLIKSSHKLQKNTCT